MKRIVNLSINKGGLDEWVSIFLRNTNAAGTTQVIFGSMIGTAGGASQFGQPPNASDDAAIISATGGRFLFSVGFVQGLSRLSNFNPYIVTELVLDGPTNIIDNVIVQYNTLHFDNTVKQELVDFAEREERTDFNTTVWRIKGPFILDSLHFIQLSLGATAINNYTVRMRIEYWKSAVQFTQV